MPKPLCFLVEESPAPIYQRIIDAISNELVNAGHKTVWLRHKNTGSLREILALTRAEKVDICLVTNNIGLLSGYSKDTDAFVFEMINLPFIFIHHDNLFSTYPGREVIAKKIRAFQNIKNRGFHFCIEPSNCSDLNNLGIHSAYPFFHASEFEVPGAHTDKFEHDVSFVGHIVPNTLGRDDNNPQTSRTAPVFWQRVDTLDSSIEPACIDYANSLESENDKVEWYAAKHYLVAEIHKLSQMFRGEIISGLGNYSLDIFGGDPAYLSGRQADRKLDKPNLHYHPPLLDYSNTRKIYRHTKINLNITSLQFDGAVINRVIDAGMSGGFILTDYKSELRNITNVYREISCKTIDELNSKIEYYLGHESERIEIARELSNDVKTNCTYKSAIRQIESAISENIINT